MYDMFPEYNSPGMLTGTVGQTTWTLFRHLKLRDSRLNRRLSAAIICMRRAVGSHKARPLHIFQTLKCMRMIICTFEDDSIAMLL